MIKNWQKFLENSEDGYSNDFDSNYSDIKSLVDQILSADKKGQYEREVLELMNKQELLDIKSSM